MGAGGYTEQPESPAGDKGGGGLGAESNLVQGKEESHGERRG